MGEKQSSATRWTLAFCVLLLQLIRLPFQQKGAVVECSPSTLINQQQNQREVQARKTKERNVIFTASNLRRRTELKGEETSSTLNAYRTGVVDEISAVNTMLHVQTGTSSSVATGSASSISTSFKDGTTSTETFRGPPSQLVDPQTALRGVVKSKLRQEHQQINVQMQLQSLHEAIINQKRTLRGDFDDADPRHRPFPRWTVDETVSSRGSSITNTTIMDSIIDFVHGTSKFYSPFLVPSMTEVVQEPMGPKEQNNITFSQHPVAGMYEKTIDHRTDIGGSLPEVLYVVSADGLYVSNTAVQIFEQFYSGAFRHKLYSMQELLIRSYNILFKNLHDGTSIGSNDNMGSSTNQLSIKDRWPYLNKIFHEKQRNGRSMTLPIILFHGDYTGCNKNNYFGTSKMVQTVPLFTVAGNVDCDNTFPMPNYQTWDDSKETATEWIQEHSLTSRIGSSETNRRTTEHDQRSEMNMKEMWLRKTPKVVWRGGLTGKMPAENVTARGLRYQITRYVHTEPALEHLHPLTEAERDLFDVKLIRLSASKVNPLDYINATELGGSSPMYRMSMDQFSNYRAVLDVDGHSWSSRFGKLLCSQSVVVKVEPQWVDYFHYSRKQNEFILQPWKHYIPVKSDLSDLVRNVQYAVSSDNVDHVNAIIQNANEWCQSHMIRDALAYDLLDIMDSYTSTLALTSPEWESKWQTYQEDVGLLPASIKRNKDQYDHPLHMIKVV